jgi:hypothetical protein
MLTFGTGVLIQRELMLPLTAAAPNVNIRDRCADSKGAYAPFDRRCTNYIVVGAGVPIQRELMLPLTAVAPTTLWLVQMC